MKIEFEKEEMEKLGISSVFLFGSQAQGTSSSLSDYDFAILLNDNSVLNNRKLRNEIYEKFYELVSSKIKKLVNIDIIFLHEASLEIKYHVVKDGVLLYTNDMNNVFFFQRKSY
jgi:predicted nucleotidyltransferase